MSTPGGSTTPTPDWDQSGAKPAEDVTQAILNGSISTDESERLAKAVEQFNQDRKDTKKVLEQEIQRSVEMDGHRIYVRPVSNGRYSGWEVYCTKCSNISEPVRIKGYGKAMAQYHKSFHGDDSIQIFISGRGRRGSHGTTQSRVKLTKSQKHKMKNKRRK